MAGTGELAAGPEESYRPVRAMSVTGLFPGFARPHFVPGNDRKAGSAQTNTLYVQIIADERIVSFEPLEEGITGTMVNLDSESCAVAPGDVALYVYAFGPDDAVAGSRSVVARTIEQRFDEIAPKPFAACTAAQFARLKELLPGLNRQAFGLLAEISAASARQWRDSTVFRTMLRDEFHVRDVPSDHVRLESRDKGKRLEVMLTLRLDHPREMPVKQIEKTCRELLVSTGLFGPDDLFKLRIASDDKRSSQLQMVEPAELDAALREAKLFLEQKVFMPALGGMQFAQRTLDVVRDTRLWISRFQKIGDLVLYMDRFRPDAQQKLPLEDMERIGFEEVYAEFVRRFARYRGFQTTISDFREGAAYSPFTLSIYTRTYNNRGAGIRPVGEIGRHEAVVVNITLSGHKYANEWIEAGRRLKCYLKAPVKRSETQYEENHKANRSIMNHPDVPILVFTRKPKEKQFIYDGIFRYTQVAEDEDGAKWFELAKQDHNR